MGMGYVLKCKQCGYELHASTGIGFLFAKVIDETIRDMKSGKYGETAENFFQENPDGTVDCSAALFQCRKCGSIKVDKVLALYKRKEGSPEPECLLPDKKYFVKAASLDHQCEKCGHKMKKVNEDKFFKEVWEGNVACPECSGHLEIAGIFNWD